MGTVEAEGADWTGVDGFEAAFALLVGDLADLVRFCGGEETVGLWGWGFLAAGWGWGGQGEADWFRL